MLRGAGCVLEPVASQTAQFMTLTRTHKTEIAIILFLQSTKQRH